MLSVTVPPEAAIWLRAEGSAALSAELEQIPSDLSIWERGVDLGPDSAAWRLWDLIRSQRGVGRVIASKVMASKRPALIPIYDAKVAEVLLPEPRASDWARWVAYSQSGESADELKLLAGIAGGSFKPRISLLRIIDIVIWMRTYGDPELAAIDGPGDRRGVPRG